jgi:hypothetical protein
MEIWIHPGGESSYRLTSRSRSGGVTGQRSELIQSTDSSTHDHCTPITRPGASIFSKQHSRNHTINCRGSCVPSRRATRIEYLTTKPQQPYERISLTTRCARPRDDNDRTTRGGSSRMNIRSGSSSSTSFDPTLSHDGQRDPSTFEFRCHHWPQLVVQLFQYASRHRYAYRRPSRARSSQLGRRTESTCLV